MKFVGHYKCPACVWVHVRVVIEDTDPPEVVQAHEKCRQCFRCGAPTLGFLRAQPGDCPLGSTLQACVIDDNDPTDETVRFVAGILNPGPKPHRRGRK